MTVAMSTSHSILHTGYTKTFSVPLSIHITIGQPEYNIIYDITSLIIAMLLLITIQHLHSFKIANSVISLQGHS